MAPELKLKPALADLCLVMVSFFEARASAGQSGLRPIKVVPRFKRVLSAFHFFQNFEDRSSTARVTLILVRRPEILRGAPC